MRRGRAAWIAAASLLSWPAFAHAHSFGKLYNLPVPFWMYAWGAAGALLVSFVAVGWFVTRPPQADAVAPASREIGVGPWRRIVQRVHGLGFAQGFSLALLVLCIATGLLGTRNPYLNFNMTFFWIVFVLGFTYACALAGDWYAVLSPWRLITQGLGERAARAFAGRRAYPARWGVWPALVLYMAFIWLELFGRVKPLSLAVGLLVYAAITLIGAWWFGASAWLRHGELFAVFLRLVAKMAPLAVEPSPSSGGPLRLRWRAPFAGLLESQAHSRSEVLFVLFMLSSTAYDGLHATAPWSKLFWVDLYHALQPGLVDANIVKAYPTLLKINLAWETAAMLLSPFAYCAAFLLALWLAKMMTRSRLSVHELSLRFAYSLLPIALVYNVTHYWTLIVTQGTQIVRLASDPFGVGWNLFGTARFLPLPIIPDMGIVWHTQVGLILFGHVVSVVIAHLEALRVFGDRRRATLSQVPMLALMVLFTTVGLWILAQPIQGGR